jgi:hypothetical protein
MWKAINAMLYATDLDLKTYFRAIRKYILIISVFVLSNVAYYHFIFFVAFKITIWFETNYY